MLTVLLVIVHVFVCVVLIAVVLLQTGKRADLAGAFGGGGSQTAFGARGAATFLSKATTWSAGMFMVTCILLTVMSARSVSSPERSVLDEVQTPAPPPVETPQQPVPPPSEAPSNPPSESAPPPPPSSSDGAH